MASLGADVQPRSTVQLFMSVSDVEKRPSSKFFLGFEVSFGEEKPFVTSNASFWQETRVWAAKTNQTVRRHLSACVSIRFCPGRRCSCVRVRCVLSFATKMFPSQTRCSPASAGDLRFARAASRESRPISWLHQPRLTLSLTPCKHLQTLTFAAESRIRNLLHQPRALSLLTDKGGRTDCWIRRKEKRD